MAAHTPQRDARGRFATVTTQYREPAPAPVQRVSAVAETPAEAAAEFAALLAPPETRELNALLAKPRRGAMRLVSFCSLCGRVGGGCAPVEREVPEDAVRPGDWGHEYVALEHRRSGS